jgi:hypothetical protein
MKAILLGLGATALLFSTGCSSSLAQPFQQMKTDPITVYRLQNFEPPAASPTAPTSPVAIPPQIQQWLNGAATMLPPGLIPPGLLPGAAPSPAQANAQRFHNFRILGTVQVTDGKQRDEILDLFGHDSNFTTPNQQCMYAEFGFQFGQGSAGALQGTPSSSMPADVLVSLSCDQVQMINYGWPYGTKTGITADSAKRIAAIVQKAFGG